MSGLWLYIFGEVDCGGRRGLFSFWRGNTAYLSEHDMCSACGLAQVFRAEMTSWSNILVAGPRCPDCGEEHSNDLYVVVCIYDVASSEETWISENEDELYNVEDDGEDEIENRNPEQHSETLEVAV